MIIQIQPLIDCIGRMRDRQQPVRKFLGHSEWPVTIAAAGTRIFTGGYDSTIRQWPGIWEGPCTLKCGTCITCQDPFKFEANMNHHLAELCPNRIAPCPWCHAMIVFHKLEHHQASQTVITCSAHDMPFIGSPVPVSHREV